VCPGFRGCHEARADAGPGRPAGEDVRQIAPRRDAARRQYRNAQHIEHLREQRQQICLPAHVTYRLHPLNHHEIAARALRRHRLDRSLGSPMEVVYPQSEP
jgi:hypothetical protein